MIIITDQKLGLPRYSAIYTKAKMFPRVSLNVEKSFGCLFVCLCVFFIVVRKVCHQNGMLITKDEDHSSRYVAVKIDS